MTAHATCHGAHEENHPPRVGTCLFGTLNLKGYPFSLSHKFCLDMECSKTQKKEKERMPYNNKSLYILYPHFAFRLFTFVLETLLCFNQSEN